MDSWPEWVRWVTLLPVIVVLPVALYFIGYFAWGALSPWLSLSVQKYLGLLLVYFPTVLFVWSGIAVAPRLKFVVAIALGLFAFYVAYVSHGVYLDYDQKVYPVDFGAVSFAGGAITAWVLAFWGYLRRRRAVLPATR